MSITWGFVSTKIKREKSLCNSWEEKKLKKIIPYFYIVDNQQ
jgi:hypothetical protein